MTLEKFPLFKIETTTFTDTPPSPRVSTVLVRPIRWRTKPHLRRIEPQATSVAALFPGGWRCHTDFPAVITFGFSPRDAYRAWRRAADEREMLLPLL